ncbi:RNA-binding motif protein X-linked 2 [Euphorbia peplus]|nr:RNA-binding motif protein X-linked 2 [Euphorbia peplus]
MKFNLHSVCVNEPFRYGEIVDVNLVRDKATGKSKGFAFVAYEDQTSTILAVDNLNGAKVCDRIVRVDHVTNYKKKEEEDEETMQAKREARGVSRAFQRADCTRGASCKFSHDEQRAANTGWGAPGDRSPKWGHDKFGGPNKGEKRSGTERPLEGHLKQIDSMEDKRSRRLEDNEVERKSKEDYHGRDERRSRRHEGDAKLRDDEYRIEEKRLKRLLIYKRRIQRAVTHFLSAGLDFTEYHSRSWSSFSFRWLRFLYPKL